VSIAFVMRHPTGWGSTAAGEKSGAVGEFDYFTRRTSIPRRSRWFAQGPVRRLDGWLDEVEALQLEYTWIKQFDPRFNVRYRDDKS